MIRIVLKLLLILSAAFLTLTLIALVFNLIAFLFLDPAAYAVSTLGTNDSIYRAASGAISSGIMVIGLYYRRAWFIPYVLILNVIKPLEYAYYGLPTLDVSLLAIGIALMVLETLFFLWPRVWKEFNFSWRRMTLKTAVVILLLVSFINLFLQGLLGML